MKRIVWFSCGAASAVASKLAIEKYRDVDVVYCDTSVNEHPDNLRFLQDCEEWLGQKIVRLRSEKFSSMSIYDVFDKTGYLVGPYGARCTTELKKKLRQNYTDLEDVNILGYTIDEKHRIERFEKQNPEIRTEWVLVDEGCSKQDCFALLQKDGVTLPEMYRLGYHNANCIGCVKGGMGYWNKIRKDFPDVFARMVKQERKMGRTVLKNQYLDELEETKGQHKDLEFSCGLFC